MEPLSPAARRNLRAQAHPLEPVVTVGHHGLTPPVLHEIDVALLAHELIKVRVLGDDRGARAAMLGEVAAALDCAPVQHVGKVLVLWRPNPEKAAARKPAPAKAAAAPAPARRGKPTPVDAVRARRRATSPAWGSTAAPASTGGRRGAARHAATTGAAPAPPRRRRPRDA
ncbi:MAG: YhbY family RNA-binding protein [Burkholderiales bacterium]|nr:YhbY family RNA-binding protein [Burkholderiales bacterium]